jgi:hypothetical protein
MLILRPAESAVRRLILIAAHGLKPTAAASRTNADFPSPLWGPKAGETRGSPWQAGVGVASAASQQETAGRHAFKLFDPLKRFDPETIWDHDTPPFVTVSSFFDPSLGFHEVPSAFAPVNATHIGQRLNALMRALDNLPAQARRLVRWQQKRDAALKSLMLGCEQREPRSTHTWSPRRLSPMRPGLPPGWRERKVHEVDDVLRECHGLANDLLNAPDTG